MKKKDIYPEKAERIMLGIYTKKDGRRIVGGSTLEKHGRKWNDILWDALQVLDANGGEAFNIREGDWIAAPFGGDMKSRLMALYEKQDWKGIVETMAQNPGDKGNIVSMLDDWGENVDFWEGAKA